MSFPGHLLFHELSRRSSVLFPSFFQAAGPWSACCWTLALLLSALHGPFFSAFV